MIEMAAFEALLERNPIARERMLYVNPPEGWHPPAGACVMTLHWGQFRHLQQSGAEVVWGPDALLNRAEDIERYQAAVIAHPKSRSELLWLLNQVADALEPQASVLCVGHKKSGIEGSFRQLGKLGLRAEKVDAARHCQVWAFQGSMVPDVPDSESMWRLEWGGRALQVAALPGVFAEGRLDAGTRLLLDTLEVHPLPAGKVLDFGCGAGVLTAVMACNGSYEVDAVDVQWQAVACTRRTLQLNGLSGKVWPSDGLADVEGRYDAIVTNPPFHEHVRQTTAVTERFLREVARHLNRGGRLRLVANAFLPYADLLANCIGPFDVLAETPAYKVYEARFGG